MLGARLGAEAIPEEWKGLIILFPYDSDNPAGRLTPYPLCLLRNLMFYPVIMAHAIYRWLE